MKEDEEFNTHAPLLEGDQEKKISLNTHAEPHVDKKKQLMYSFGLKVFLWAQSRIKAT